MNGIYSPVYYGEGETSFSEKLASLKKLMHWTESPFSTQVGIVYKLSPSRSCVPRRYTSALWSRDGPEPKLSKINHFQLGGSSKTDPNFAAE